MAYLIDTNIAIHARDGDVGVLAKLAENDRAVLLSALSLAELQRGLHKSPGMTAALQVRLDILLRAFPLFLILLVWQVPHFLAIATFRREEYARAGLVVEPNVSGLAKTRRSILLYSALLFAVSLSPLAIGMAGLWYGVVALLLNVGFFWYAAFGQGHQTPERWAKTLFLASLPYLVLMYAALVISAM